MVDGCDGDGPDAGDGRCGSSSEGEGDEEEGGEDEDEPSLCGVCSPSGSDRDACRAICGRGPCEELPVGLGIGTSGGGSSVCMKDALLCSEAVGTAPSSTYRDPVMSL